MTSFKIGQIGLALCLMASLLLSSASACVCSHHQHEATASENECHGSHHDSEQNAENAASVGEIESECICYTNVTPPFAVSKSAKVNLKADNGLPNSVWFVAGAQYLAVSAVNQCSPDFTRTFSYSTLLESLLPSRAPPRL